MKLLAEILGMTNTCNLRCSYCEWKMKPTRRLSDAEHAAAEGNIRRIGDVVRQRFPSVVIVEYSGGEPFVYPKIVEALLDTFPDKWLRVSTNGSLIDAAMVERLAKQRTYMALSLDGSTFPANQARFHKNLTIFETVKATIARLLGAGVPVMILCTLNTTNIDAFPEFVEWLSQAHGQAIADGLLTLPAHCVSEYDRDNGRPTPEQVTRFGFWVATRAHAYPIVSRIYEHYARLAAFLVASTHKHFVEMGRAPELPPALRAQAEQARYDRTCFLFDWQVCFHFLDDAISRPEGRFTSWGCGMRAVEDLGERSIHDAELTLEAGPGSAVFRGDAPVGRRCPLLKDCFVDWNAIDMVFAGQIPLERAARWNVMFRDPQIADAVTQVAARYRSA